MNDQPSPHMLRVQRVNDKLVLYQPATGNGTWYVRIKIGPRKYTHRSLRTRSDNDALYEAIRVHAEIRTKLEHGIAITPRSLPHLIAKWLAHIEAQVKIKQASPNMLRIYKYAMIYWSEYLEGVNADAITSKHMEDYIDWRMTYWAGKIGQPSGQPWQRKRIGGGTVHTNVKPVPTTRTLQLEYSAMNKFLRWVVKEGHLRAERMPDFKFKRGKIVRRPAFTLAQYWSLMQFMRGYPAKTDDKRARWWREQLRHFIMIMANSGMRPDEARNVKWQDIEDFTMEDGKQNCIIKVRVSKTKVRETVPRVNCYRHLMRWKELAKHTKPGDYVFHTEAGKPVVNMREGFNKAVRLALVESGSWTKEETAPLSIYSLRHTYITFALRYSNSDIYSLAMNCGTSVEMIEKFYSDVLPRHMAMKLGNQQRPTNVDRVQAIATYVQRVYDDIAPASSAEAAERDRVVAEN